MSCETGFILMN